MAFFGWPEAADFGTANWPSEKMYGSLKSSQSPAAWGKTDLPLLQEGLRNSVCCHHLVHP
ncbi:hypothetical protein OMCYN_01778 [cyanobiont of Ornithocercus magnificus]|nr:hypothetical protein OMCYN_01778 [cyanobiont of Ornithocercus magnificus]